MVAVSTYWLSGAFHLSPQSFAAASGLGFSVTSNDGKFWSLTASGGWGRYDPSSGSFYANISAPAAWAGPTHSWVLQADDTVFNFPGRAATLYPPLSGFGAVAFTASGGSSGFTVTSNGVVLNGAGPVAGAGLPFNKPIWPAAQLGYLDKTWFPSGPAGVSEFQASGPAGTAVPPPSGITTVACAISSQLAAGWSPGLFASGAVAAALSPADPPVLMALAPAVSGGLLTSYGPPTGPSGLWVGVSSLSGIAMTGPVWNNWASTTGMCAVDAGAGSFLFFSYLGGTITLAQTITGLGAVPASIAVAANVAALIPSGNAALSITQTGPTSWTNNGQVLTGFAGTSVVVAQGVSAALGFTNGLLVARYLGSWSFLASAALSFTPTALAADVSGNWLAAGNGQVAIVNPGGSSVLATGTFAGPAAVGAAVYRSQYIVATSGSVHGLSWVPGLTTMREEHALSTALATWQTVVSGISGNTWKIATGTLSTNNILFTTDSYLLPGAAGITVAEMTLPYAVDFRRAGAYATYSGTTLQAVSTMGLGVVPMVAGVDASSHLNLATDTGWLLTISTGGTVLLNTRIWTAGGGVIGLVTAAAVSGLWGAAALAPAGIKIT